LNIVGVERVCVPSVSNAVLFRSHRMKSDLARKIASSHGCLEASPAAAGWFDVKAGFGHAGRRVAPVHPAAVTLDFTERTSRRRGLQGSAVLPGCAAGPS
jgi:hypothetical protein